LRSMRNTRIERLWVETGTQFVRRWRGFFSRLERLHMLDPQRAHHIWLLHVLFLDSINDDCNDFRDEWNCHPISGPNTNNKSPMDLRFLGQTTLGIYRDDCEGVSVDTIEAHYGVDSEARNSPRDEDASEGENLVGSMVRHHDVLANRDEQAHEAVHVPLPGNPFTSAKKEAQFYDVLHQTIIHDITPENFGLMDSEWEDGDYPIYEMIHVGRRASKDLHVSLAEPIWYDRARLWCQALVTLQLFLDLEA
ncbi:hypothetical protein EV363DRAFT_1177992, partial [Boletus edulis]